MSAPKVGDRVKVEFEGDVAEVEYLRTDCLLVIAGSARYAVEPSWVEVIAPPVKVGDKITEHTVWSLPHASLVAHDGEMALSCEHDEDQIGWNSWDGQAIRREDVYGAKVLRIGGTS